MYTTDISLAKTLTGHQNPIFALAGMPSSPTLFSAGNDKGIVEWDIASGKFVRILCAVPSSVYTLCCLPSKDMLIAGMRNGELWCVDIGRQQLIHKMKTETGAIFSIKVLHGKNELIAIGEEGTAYVWSLDSFELLYRFRVSSTTVRTIEPYPGGRQLVFGDKDGMLYLYDVNDFKEVEKKKVHSLPVTALHATETYLYSGGRDAQLFQMEQKDLAIVRNITPHMFTIYGILPHPTAPVLATVSRDKSIKLWDSTSLSLLKNVSVDRGYDGHRLSINTGLWMENQLITAGDDKLIKIWDVVAREA